MLVNRTEMYFWGIAGILLCASGLLGPVHELGHVLTGAQWVDWNHVEWPKGTITVFSLLAGYGFEYLVIAALEVICARFPLYNVPRRLRAFGFGYLICLIPWGVYDLDFSVYILNAGETPEFARKIWIFVTVPWFIYRTIALLRDYGYTTE